MSALYQHPIFTRVSLRLLAALVFVSITAVSNQPMALAQQCDMALGCTAVTIDNRTMPSQTYDVEFLLCCDGMEVIGPVVTVPSSPPIMPWVPPSPCVVIGVWSITPWPAPGWIFNPHTCLLTIH
jgi:hypothetical protein